MIMKFICYFLTLLIGTLTLFACDNKQFTIEQDLRHHRFVAVTLNNESIINNKQTFIEFGENFTVNGQMCNQFFGHAKLMKNKIEIPNLISTEKLCTDDRLNQLDIIINELLQRGAIIILNKESGNLSLTLKNDANELTFKLNDLM